YKVVAGDHPRRRDAAPAAEPGDLGTQDVGQRSVDRVEAGAEALASTLARHLRRQRQQSFIDPLVIAVEDPDRLRVHALRASRRHAMPDSPRLERPPVASVYRSRRPRPAPPDDLSYTIPGGRWPW